VGSKRREANSCDAVSQRIATLGRSTVWPKSHNPFADAKHRLINLSFSNIKIMKSFYKLTVAIALSSLPYLAHAQLSASPNWVNFGQVPVTSSRTDSVWIQNRSDEDIQNLRFWDSGDRRQFSYNDFACSYIRRGSSCTMYITYRPNRAGYHRMDLSASGTWGYLSIQVQGQAYERP
jgi:hypothetical protein